MWLASDIQRGILTTRYLDFSIYLPFSEGKTDSDFKKKKKSLHDSFLNERPHGHSAFAESSPAPLPK